MAQTAKETALLLQKFIGNEGAAALLPWMEAVEAASDTANAAAILANTGDISTNADAIAALAVRVTALENA